MAALAVLAWLLLRIAGVRPAWPVALVAPPVAFILGRAYQSFTGNPARMPDGIVILMVSCAMAALLTTPGAWRWRR